MTAAPAADRPPLAERGRWTLEVPGDLRALRRVRDLAERIARDLRLDAVTRFQVRVALHEATANAVLHGCRSPVDRVRVLATADADTLRVDVVDPGGRFEFRARPADPLAPTGRGNVLLEATTDECWIEARPGRTALRFVKRLA